MSGPSSVSAQSAAGGNGPERLDRRAIRRQETKDQIVAAAWDLVREQGLAGLAMRDLGERVGMRAQSIYSYFASKHEIYDVMFHQAYVDFADGIVAEEATPDGSAHASVAARTSLRRMARYFFDFCTSDPVRYQLLFQRTIPDFVPSEASYAVAVEAYDWMILQLATTGISDPEDVDLWTALLTGLTDQQISNDPGGDRWARVIDRAVDMFFDQIVPDISEPTPKEGQK